MSGRGAGDRPLTYAGEYDATRTYLAREVTTHAGLVYMSVAKTTGHPPPNTTYWLPLGGGAVLFVSTAAGGPPTDGSVFWWVTDLGVLKLWDGLTWRPAEAVYLEAIVKSGAAAVASNLMPPGFRVPTATTLRAVYVNVGTAPTGHALTVLVKRSGTTLATVNVAASATSGSSTGLSTALAKGDLLTVDISAVGSTVTGSDVLVTIEAY